MAEDPAARQRAVRRTRRVLRWWLNLYPPFVGAGIRVTEVSPDLSRITARMKLRWWNRNYVGTHFGGSLSMMCDPFYMVMLLGLLGDRYIVWDKTATIRFLRPGRGTVTARFHIPPEEAARIARLADTNRKVEPVFTVDVVDEAGETVASVEKLLYVRRKDRP